MDQKLLIDELEAIINNGFDGIHFPYVKGNSVRIGKMIIRKSRHGYLVYDTEKNKQIDQTFSKASAIALAKSLAHNKDHSIRIMDIDKVIEKNYMDSVYFKNSYNKTKDIFKKDVLETRLDIAQANTEHARALLDNYIYS
tara:strand:- start:467 stop:886 length:420 start_codon:yes stop_codon:yes gene_type:complete